MTRSGLEQQAVYGNTRTKRSSKKKKKKLYEMTPLLRSSCASISTFWAKTNITLFLSISSSVRHTTLKCILLPNRARRSGMSGCFQIACLSPVTWDRPRTEQQQGIIKIVSRLKSCPWGKEACWIPHMAHMLHSLHTQLTWHTDSMSWR